ncbi:MAG: arsenite methyltransferase [Chloroflexi bacterium]|nr:arsenite methyltransferase [Chloroflexota bacterium]
MTDAQRLKAEVSRHYAEKVKESADCCGTDCCGELGLSELYPVEVLEQMPAGAVTFGSGNPVGLADLSAGERVLDLGSGAGLDCFIAARRVGPSGSVVGVDFTQAMIDRAAENANELGLSNVSFKLGDIEALPQDDDDVDVIISNCVINLAPDKAAVFREAFRVLRSGGRLVVSDIVLTRPATAAELKDMALVTGCVAGSLPAEEYADTIRAAGFEDVRLEGDVEAGTENFWYSAAIRAVKP